MKNKIPSKFQIGDEVSVDFKEWLQIKSARVVKVHFTESKVSYDLQVFLVFNEDDDTFTTMYTRVYNVDSFLVKEPIIKGLDIVYTLDLECSEEYDVKNKFGKYKN